MAFSLYDGRAAFGLAGARTTTAWRKWFCNLLPVGAIVQGNEAWDLLTANDLWAPFEPHAGVVPGLAQPSALGQSGTPTSTASGAASALGPVPTGGMNLFYPQALSWRGHVLAESDGKTPLATIAPHDALACYVYLDELAPPAAIACAMLVALPGAAPTVQVAFWGENHLAELQQLAPNLANVLAAQTVGALPRPGGWQTLMLPIPTNANGAPVNVQQLILLAFGGTMAFSQIVHVVAQQNGTFVGTPVFGRRPRARPRAPSPCSTASSARRRSCRTTWACSRPRRRPTSAPSTSSPNSPTTR